MRSSQACTSAGNREPKEANEKVWPKQSEVKESSNLALAQKSRRFMIYVHSKLLIADDEVRFRSASV
jgi:phospholipase D1/2